MPTEHEYKYLLSPNNNLGLVLNNSILIEQGFINSEGHILRIRKFTNKNSVSWFLTFKQKVTDRLIEIETELDNRDGEELWSICKKKVKKRRCFYINDGVTWEIDFFEDSNNLVYFSMAEVELPEGSSRPKVPSLIKKFLIKEIELTDDRFSNTKLGDMQYAKSLYLKKE